MARTDLRLAAQAAYVARRLHGEAWIESPSPGETRRIIEGVLIADRERERALDQEVDAILRQNAQTIRSSGADHAELFRKAKKLLAEKKKIPL